MVLDGFEGVLGWVWDVLGWLLAGLGIVWGLPRHGFEGPQSMVLRLSG